MKINDFGALTSNSNATNMVQEAPLEVIDPRQFFGFRAEQGSADYT